MADRYMRFVFSVIAVALAWLCLRPAALPQANGGVLAGDIKEEALKVPSNERAVPRSWGRLVAVSTPVVEGMPLTLLYFEAPDGTVRVQRGCLGCQYVRK